MIEMTWTDKPSYFMTTRREDRDGSLQPTDRKRPVAALNRRPAR